jgi:hypothetical protein
MRLIAAILRGGIKIERIRFFRGVIKIREMPLEQRGEFGAGDGSRGGGIKIERVRFFRGVIKIREMPLEQRGEFGAGDGNRTHMASLEGWSITTMLHPLSSEAGYYNAAAR